MSVSLEEFARKGRAAQQAVDRVIAKQKARARGRGGPAKAEAPTFKRDRNGLVRCRVCGCTEIDACAGGCSWVEADLCSTCAVPAEALAAWMLEARWPCMTRLLREVRRRVESQ